MALVQLELREMPNINGWKLVFLVFITWGCTGSETSETPETPDDVDLLEPTEACVTYLDCLRAVESSEIALEEAVYGVGSDCWVDAAAALGCTTECEEGVGVEHAGQPTAPECWPGGQPVSEVLFAAVGDRWTVTSSEPLGCEGEVEEAEFDDRPEGFGLRLRSYTETLFWYECTFDGPNRAFSCERSYEKGTLTGRFTPTWEELAMGGGPCQITFR
ncbi:MAG: hypothetical protein KTR31_13235 [Myxococcales bacterium]|nr:hypothetical protein [Myxococcales bacterium]